MRDITGKGKRYICVRILDSLSGNETRMGDDSIMKKEYPVSKWKTVQCVWCEYSWSTDLERPDMCPQCKSYSWDAPGKRLHRKPKKE
jgi:hypothetical protein